MERAQIEQEKERTGHILAILNMHGYYGASERHGIMQKANLNDNNSRNITIAQLPNTRWKCCAHTQWHVAEKLPFSLDRPKSFSFLFIGYSVRR